MTRPIATIDLTALRHNFAVVQRYAPQAKIMAVVKADAYGHGMLPVAQALAGLTDAFAVARLEEAVQLREAGIMEPVVILEGVFSVDELQQVVELALTPVFQHPDQLEWFHQSSLTLPAGAWLKVDTGMHRLGVSVAAASDSYQRLLPKITGEFYAGTRLGLMTHFACADAEPILGSELGLMHESILDLVRDPILDPVSEQQASADQKHFKKHFKKQLTAAEAMLVECRKIAKAIQQTSQETNYPLGSNPFPVASMANSAAIMSAEKSHHEWVRPGIMLYGVSPFAGKAGVDLNLRPVMRLTARVITVKTVAAGAAVGYGATWQAHEDARIAIVAAGYADGVPWQAAGSIAGSLTSSSTEQITVSIHGQPCSMIGRISMDSMAVLLPRAASVSVGDVAEVWGGSVPVERWAEAAGSIGYAMLTGVSARVARVYIQD